MKCELLLVLLLFSCGFCDQCVTYNFEKDFDIMFSSEAGICSNMRSWTLNEFTSLEMESPHPLSTMFVSPESLQSCISSISFLMTDGTLETQVFMENVQPTDFINVLVMNTNGGLVANSLYNLVAQNFKPGWNVLKIILEIPGGFDGFIALMGSASVGSVVLVDSLRYIPPSMNEDDEDCIIYSENLPPEPPAGPTDAPIDSNEDVSSVTESTNSTEDQTGPDVTIPATLGSTDSTEEETGSTMTETSTTDEDSTTVTETENPGDGVVTTPKPIDESGFWNPLTIAMVTVISTIVLIFICMMFYQIGQWRAAKLIQPVVIPEVDYNNLPKSMTVPRVTTVYSDAGLNPFRTGALQA